MKAYEEIEVPLHAFLTSAIDGHSYHFTAEESPATPILYEDAWPKGV
jgi:hypothetical protein